MASASPTHRIAKADRRAARLAEMVVGLTGCEPDGALAAVVEHTAEADPLAVVARAMVTLETSDPNPPTPPSDVDRFRVAGFLRGDGSMPSRRPLAGRRRPVRAIDLRDALVIPHPGEADGADRIVPSRSDEVVFDLRLRRARIHLK